MWQRLGHILFNLSSSSFLPYFPSPLVFLSSRPGMTDTDLIINPTVRCWSRSFYRDIKRLHWSDDEIRPKKDIKCWLGMTSQLKEMTKKVMLFFTEADKLVGKNINTNFQDSFPEDPWIEAFYVAQAEQEKVHEISYAKFLWTYMYSKREMASVKTIVSASPVVQRKIDWVKHWMNDETTDRATRVVAFSVAEGIFFQSSFAIIQTLLSLNMLKELGFLNGFIMRDEGLHRDFAYDLYKWLCRMGESVDPEVIRQIVTEAVDIECAFVDETLPEAVEHFNPEHLKEYIKVNANQHMYFLGFEDDELYPGVENRIEASMRTEIMKKVNRFEDESNAYLDGEEESDEDDNDETEEVEGKPEGDEDASSSKFPLDCIEDCRVGQ